MKIGDKLLTIDVKMEDGSECDGGLSLGEIVTLNKYPHSDWIWVERANGKIMQYEKKRFALIYSVCNEHPL
jgi:hypothetical protein